MRDQDKGGCVLTAIIIGAILLLVPGGLGAMAFLRHRQRQARVAALQARVQAMQQAERQMLNMRERELERLTGERALEPMKVALRNAAAADTTGSAGLLAEPVRTVEMLPESGRTALHLTGADGRVLLLELESGPDGQPRALRCAGQPLQPGQAPSRALYGLLLRMQLRAPSGGPEEDRSLLDFLRLLEEQEFSAALDKERGEP